MQDIVVPGDFKQAAFFGKYFDKNILQKMN